MKTKKLLPLLLLLALPGVAQANITVTNLADSGPGTLRQAIANAASVPFDQIGRVVQQQCCGEGLSVAATPDGALLRCVFQRMNGHATAEGLWINSTADSDKGESFRVMACAAGRGNGATLSRSGTVTVADKLVRFIRSGLTEEYSVSLDGVRQDFIIAERPSGKGRLCVELAVDGAKVEQLADGARLVLSNGRRTVVYHGLRAVDALGKELEAKMKVLGANRLAVVLNDDDAKYPVRIDPTFTDADWSSLGGVSTNGVVFATAVDGSGNLYIGGNFTSVGGVPANNIAKWNGSSWSALGSGVSYGSGDPIVYALAVAGSDLYVGGVFTSAGSTSAFCLAKWNGSTWSTLGAGVDNAVVALAVSDTNLYVGGSFSMAGETSAIGIAKWNGSTWSPLGAGVNDVVWALTIMGTDLYAGGYFTTAGGNTVNHVAKWDGNAWSPLQNPLDWAPGVNGNVYALAVSGTDLYVGGAFGQAGGYYNTVNVARWDGSEWWELGAGVKNTAFALAVSGTNIYVGGAFTKAGDIISGVNANYIAKWDGSTWSALGSGLNNWVMSLTVSGSSLYVGGYFTNAGGLYACGVAKANIGAAAPAAAPFFTSIVPNPSRTQALLTYTADPGASFYLLSSTNLTSWQTNTTVNATGVTNTVLINVTQPREFYRLRQLP